MVDTRGRERYFPTKWTILSRQILQLNSGGSGSFRNYDGYARDRIS